MSYDNLKIVAGWIVAVEYEKTMQWLTLLEPDQHREEVAASKVEQQQRSANWCNAVQCSAHAVQSSINALFSEG